MTFKVKGFRHTVLFPERHLNAKWFKYKLNYKKDTRDPCEQRWEEDFFLCGACNAQHFSFVSQEHVTPDYFQIILQTPLNTMGRALSVGCT